MSREIKFRVWASNDANPNGKMYYPTDYVEAQVGNHKDGKNRAFIITQHGILLICCADILQPIGIGKASVCNNGIDIMQFTGLKDKNSKEIYEGDIVKCIDHPTEVESGMFEVWFSNGAFLCRKSQIILRDWGTAWIEVIGNIYENPNLLKP